MNLFNSIRWRLQLWYGLLLLLVLAGLGLAAYELERAKIYRGADQGLMRRVNVLASALHNPQHPPRRGPPGEFAPPDGPDQGGPGYEPGDAPPPRGFGRQMGFRIPPRDQTLFDAADPNGFYYVIFDRDGGQIAASTNAPAGIEPPPPPAAPSEAPAPNEPPSDPNNPAHPPHGSVTGGTPHNRDNYREILVTTPPGDSILVGHNIQPELAELRRTAYTLAAVGLAILALALAVGYWLVARALRPIDTIGAAAARIAGGDLAQRIDLAETESELGRLAAVLNATFARLEAAFAQQQQFAANAAHELRTPVTVILTQTQMALARERTAADYRQTLEACQRAAQRMRRLIESLLELTRFDAGQETLKRLPFDLANTAREAVDLVTPLAQEHGLQLTCDAEPLEVTGDAERLGQVILNLLTNALTYNRPGGSVTLRLRAVDGLAVLEVSDTGQGIAPEDLPRVFERFYRGDASRTGSANTGLGLSICKAIVEAHGGTLEAASEPGHGSTFTLRLPR